MKTTAFLIFLMLPHSVFAGWYGDATIDRMWIDSTGVMFGFSTTPPDCTGSHAFAHARLPSEVANFEEIYSLLLAARMSGKTVDIWYTDPGNCTSQNTVLSVTAAGLHQGQN